MSDNIFLETPSQDELPVAPAPNDSPKAPNAFFQLIKGLCYFLLFITSQFLATFILIFYYAFKLTFERATDENVDASKIVDDVLEIVSSDTNSFLIVYGFIFLFLLLITFAIRKKNVFEETQFRKFSPKYLPAIALLTFGLYFLVSSVLNFLPKSWMTDYAESSSFISEGSFVLSMFTQALIAPLTEELTFRGLMLSRFDKALPKWIGISISSLLFGLIHGNAIWFIYAAALGCIFCIIAEYTGSIFSTFLMHCVFNASGTIFAYLFPQIDFKGYLIFLILGIPMIIASFYLLHRTHKSEKAVMAANS